MGSARKLLLVAALALAIAADARTDARLSTLTLSPGVSSLITTRDGTTTTDPPSNTVIGSAASDSNKVTESPATDTPATTAPTTSESDSTSTSDSGDQETTDAPPSAPATVSPRSSSDRSTNDSAAQTDATTTSASVSSASKSSTASVDSLNDNNGALSAGDSSNMATILPVVFGALACVGALVMAVTYKKKRDSNTAENDSTRPSSDFEYSGADFTPDNRTLSAVQENSPPVAIKGPIQGTQKSADMSASAAIADFTGTNSSVTSTSPFGSTRGKVRVSSPVQSFFSNSEPNMEFQDTCPRHEEGSNVVLTFDEVRTDSSRAAPQVQL